MFAQCNNISPCNANPPSYDCIRTCPASHHMSNMAAFAHNRLSGNHNLVLGHLFKLATRPRMRKEPDQRTENVATSLNRESQCNKIDTELPCISFRTL
jgi:hypothetical protein